MVNFLVYCKAADNQYLASSEQKKDTANCPQAMYLGQLTIRPRRPYPTWRTLVVNDQAVSPVIVDRLRAIKVAIWRVAALAYSCLYFILWEGYSRKHSSL